MKESKHDLGRYVSKEFLRSQRGKELLRLISSDRPLGQKCQQILSTLQISHQPSHAELQELLKKVRDMQQVMQTVEGKILEVRAEQGEESGLDDHLQQVRATSSAYRQLQDFLDSVRQMMKEGGVSREQVIRFQQLVLRVEEEVGLHDDRLDQFEQTDPVTDPGSYLQMLEKLPTTKSRRDDLVDRRLPRMRHLLSKVKEFLGIVETDIDITGILKRLEIPFDQSAARSFYAPGEGAPRGVTVEQVMSDLTEKQKPDLISELFGYLLDQGYRFSSGDVIPASDEPSVYVWVRELGVTVVISNLYGKATHIYPTKVPIDEIHASTIQTLKEKYGALHLYYRFEGEGLSARRSRMVSGLDQQRRSVQSFLSESDRLRPVVMGSGHRRKYKLQEIYQNGLRRSDLEVGKTYPGIVTGSSDHKLFVAIGGRAGEEIYGHVMKRDLGSNMPTQYQEVTVSIRKIFSGSGHIEFDLISE